MIILWTKYPDITLPTHNSKAIRGVVEFKLDGEYYVHRFNTAYMYSDEDGFGTSPNRDTLSYSILCKFII